MSVEEELVRRLGEGLPASEAPQLLQRFKEERARRMAPAKNPHKFEDQHAQKLSDLWFSQRETATVEQKNAVGLTYISKVLGLGNKVARRFAEGDNRAYHQVGMKQAGVPPSADLSGFWKEMEKLFPGVYTYDDISFFE